MSNWWSIFEFFPIMEIVWTVVLLIFFYCRRGNKRFDVHFRRIRLVFFLLSEDDDNDACEGKNGGKVFMSRQSSHFFL